MTTADDEQLDELRRPVALARSGRQRDAVDSFLELVNGDDPVLAWIAADAQLGWNWWSGFTGEAADMVERVVLRFGYLAVRDEFPARVDFAMAVVAGAYYDRTELGPRLHRMADALPESFGLAAELRRTAAGVAELPTFGLPEALGTGRPLLRYAQELAARDPRGLSAGDAESLWRAASSASHPDLLVRLHDAGSVPPPEAPVKWALSQALFEAARPFEAEEVLLSARTDWRPFTWWQTLPQTPVLAPGLRPVVTARVQQEYLNRPIADGGG